MPLRLRDLKPGRLDEVSEGFGRGLYSVSLIGAADAVQRENIQPGKVGDVRGRLHLIENESTRRETFALSFQAAFDAFGGRGEAKASFSKSLRFSSNTLLLVMERSVVTTSLRIVDPKLTDNAKGYLDTNGPDLFLKNFGDVFINEITFGASLYVIIKYEAHSSEEAQSLRASYTQQGTPISGAAETTSTLFQKVATSEVFFEAASFGYPNLPDVGSFKGDDTRKLDSLLSFFDNYEERVTAGGNLGKEIAFETMRMEQALGAFPGGMKDLSERYEELKAAASLKDQIQERISDYAFATANPPLFQENSGTISQALAWLIDKNKELESYAERVFAAPWQDPPNLTFHRTDIPAPPHLQLTPDVLLRVNALDLSGRHFSGNGGEQVGASMQPGSPPPTGTAMWAKVWLELAPFNLDLGVTIHAAYNPDVFSAGVAVVDYNALVQPPMGWWGFHVVSMSLTGAAAPRYTILYKIRVLAPDSINVKESEWLRDGQAWLENPGNNMIGFLTQMVGLIVRIEKRGLPN